MPFELTREQQAVVDNRGGNLLVSAAAGSGKTRVLVERLMGYVEQGEDIDRFLVITFTNAAAAELRERIAAAIHSRLALRPEDRHLHRNATLVYQAPICTIDAYCQQFLRQWGHLADLDPDFRLCDDAEGDELRRQALEKVLEERYANIQADPAFAALVDALAGERDDQTLEEVVLDMHSRVQAQADPRRWLLERRADFDLPPGAQPGDTAWGRALLEDARELADYWMDVMDNLRQALHRDSRAKSGPDAPEGVLEANYGDSLNATWMALCRLSEALCRGWDSAAACLPIPFPPVGRKRGECDERLRELVKGERERCKKQLSALGERFSVTGEEAMEDLRAVAPAMTALLEVTEEFDRAFQQAKRRRHLMDFADGEHLTARLLVGEDGAPTDLARDLSRGFVEIMVDEYQDTNAVQNAIFNALSRGDNLFLVGDVKQSIYRFRLADPTLFLDKYRRYLPWEQAAPGQDRLICLSQNFRSRPEVLDGANFVFQNIMTRTAGELDYTPAEALRPGRADLPPDPRYQVEFNCLTLDSVGGEDEEQAPKDLLEARAVARRVRELLDSGLPVGERPVAAEDVVLLLRSPGPVLRHYAAALDEQGIPWSAQGGREFFGTTEVSVAMALLQITDNPRQDVPLLAALRSPVFGFTPDRLARLRAGREGSVYDVISAAARAGEADCAQFLDLLEQLRERAAEESSHRLLWYIYQRTDLPALFAALPEGEERRANLMALYDEACRFESGGHRGLMAFLLHLSRMAENGLSVPVAGREGGGVRILSIHKAKGLEFPVVFLCGLERRFNEADTSSTVLFHPELGLGPKRTDRERMLRYTTIARDAVALRLRRQLRAEEMRLLYVAMTRAEHKLILFCAAGRYSTVHLPVLARRAQCPPSPRQVAEGRSMAEWILTPALCRWDSYPLWAATDQERQEEPLEGGLPWDFRLLDGADYLAPAGPGGGGAAGEEALPLPPDAMEALTWNYPHLSGADIPSKLTATQLKGRQKDMEAAEEAGQAGPVPPAPPQAPLRPPHFDGRRPLTPAQRGTALHMVMQYLDFDRAVDREQVAREIARLVAGRYITPQQGEAVDPADIMAFFDSELGRRLRCAPRVEREFKFSMLVPAADYYPQAEAGEEVLLQGVVDCWFEEADGAITVVDFKTDRVTPDTVAARAREYRPQLEAYTWALAAVTDKPVARRCLWFFALGQAVDL